ncbi:hypothetical protein ROG8370_03621 [Roseovarius gaetbuli]|uniref:HMA domain-containing protein n=1 Tax=Roseovarius gaetbuli TaxID=1356575 RepID=A0A1X7A9L8_9RHOB|nr:hypothetical protein [Roseovarius gaetbuli]SLN73777.1 hypothetical protein ROG8370_03621 [Roseovarius gaetbuli]
MKQITQITLMALGLALAAGGAQAACQIEYKAKRDKPLELYYDVTTVNAPCSSAESALRAQLAGKGLKLLKVMSKKEK